MANVQRSKQKAFGYINTAMSILDKLPPMESSSTLLSANVSSDPFEFLLDLLKATEGYDKLVEKLSNMISEIVPIMEGATKSMLLANMASMISTCSINPFLSYEVLKNGIVLDIRNIDIRNILSLCPLDRDSENRDFKIYAEDGSVRKFKSTVNFVRSAANHSGKSQRIGCYYYHDCDDFGTTDELVKSKDFNAFTWYAKNRAIGRSVWYGGDNQGKAPLKSVYAKQKKEDGIVTLEYTPSPGLLKTADGDDMPVQTPFQECLHVFIGNTKEVSPDAESLERRKSELVGIMGMYNDIERQCLELEKRIADQKRENRKADRNNNEDADRSSYVVEGITNTAYGAIDDSLKLSQVNISSEISINEQVGNVSETLSVFDLNSDDEERLKTLRSGISGHGGNSVSEYLAKHNVRVSVSADGAFATMYVESLNTSITIPGECYVSSRKKTEKELRKLYEAVYQMGSLNDAYRTVEQNYYFGKTLFEFNTDYVMSLKLFDEKVIAAQLIDSMTNCLNFDVSLSIEDTYIREQVCRMVQDIVRSDDTVVSDCFFSFSNDDYNAMLERTQLRRAGLYTEKGEEFSVNRLTAEEILSNLNSISSSSTKEEIQSVIAGSIFAISKAVSATNTSDNGINVQADLSFLEKMLVNLVMSIVNSLLSPKVYLVTAINLHLFGKNPNFNIMDFITENKTFIVSLIRSIRDRIIEYLTDMLLASIGDIAKAISTQLVLEQYEYYRDLVMSCIECYKNHARDWNMADVTADIYDTATDNNPNKEC